MLQILDELSPILKVLGAAGGAAGLMWAAWYLTQGLLSKTLKANEEKWTQQQTIDAERWEAAREDHNRQWEARMAQDSRERDRQYAIFEKQMEIQQMQASMLATVSAELKAIAASQAAITRALENMGANFAQSIGTLHGRVDRALEAKGK